MPRVKGYYTALKDASWLAIWHTLVTMWTPPLSNILLHINLRRNSSCDWLEFANWSCLEPRSCSKSVPYSGELYSSSSPFERLHSIGLVGTSGDLKTKRQLTSWPLALWQTGPKQSAAKCLPPKSCRARREGRRSNATSFPDISPLIKSRDWELIPRQI